MKAVDTSVLVRLVTGDDARQESVIVDMMQEARLLVSLPVILETEWVLRSHYKWPRQRIATALHNLAILDGIDIERISGVLWAIERLSHGADFADMIHLIAAGDAEAFVTFDRDIEKVAGDNPPVTIQTLA